MIGNAETKKSLQRLLAFTQPFMKGRLKAFGGQTALGGVLLYGPPGNSKTRFVFFIQPLHI